MRTMLFPIVLRFVCHPGHKEEASETLAILPNSIKSEARYQCSPQKFSNMFGASGGVR
jgi:hypothetical protein